MTIGGNPAPVTSQSHGEIVCTLPSGQGVNLPVVVSVGEQVSATAQFSYDPPSLSVLGPDRGLASESVQITLQGSNFGLNPSVSIGGQAVTVLSHDHESILVQKPVTPGGDLAVIVLVGTRASNPLNFRSVNLTSLPGYYVDLDSEAVLPAPPGHFTSTANAISPTPAPAGSYCPVQGMQASVPASPGYYVPAPGQSEQMPAELGSAAAGSGNIAASPVLAGSYTPILGCRSGIPAPEGTYVPAAGASSALPVPAGFTTSGEGAAALIPLPNVRVLSFDPGPGGSHTIQFETAEGQSYGIYYSQNLIDYVHLENVAGTGSPASRNIGVPMGHTGRGFFVIGPAASP